MDRGRLLARAFKYILVPRERRVLSGKTIGVGFATEGPIDSFFLEARCTALKKALERRNVIIAPLTPLQIKWMMTPVEQRGSYAQLGIESFPDAKCYAVLAMKEGVLRFNMYGAAFDVLLEGSTDAMMAAILHTLDHYFEEILCGRIILLMHYHPEAFSGQLWYPPQSTREEVKKIFTLPPYFR